MSANIIHWLQYFSAAFAFVAGGLWLTASLVPSPKALTVITIGDTGFGDELPKLFEAFSRQSRWNAGAAAFASVSAILQAITVIADAGPK